MKKTVKKSKRTSVPATLPPEHTRSHAIQDTVTGDHTTLSHSPQKDILLTPSWKTNIYKPVDKQFLLILFLLIGLLTTVFLVQKRQNYQSKAQLNMATMFTVTDPQGGQSVSCSGTTCATDADSVHIEFIPSQENLEDLKSELQ